MAVSSSRGNALDRDLDEIFSQFPSQLLEIERHFLTANIVMCDLFIQIRTEDYARFFVASVAQAGISDTLMHNVQELLTVLENNTQDFQGRFLVFLREEKNFHLELCKKTIGRAGRPKQDVSFGEIECAVFQT